MPKSSLSNPPERLTLSNLQLSPEDQAALLLLSKAQRKALFNLCTIFHLTFYEEGMRKAAHGLRDLIRKNTLDPQHNKCDFDKTDKEKILEAPLRKNAYPK